MLLLYREAQRKEIERSLNTLTLLRASQAKKEDFDRIVSEMKVRMNQIQMGTKESVNQNWLDLKKRG